MFMGGQSKENPLQGLCQGNGAGPVCWLMLSSVLMHCYEHQGFGLRIISHISGAIIDFLGEIYVNNMDLIITRLEFTTEKETQEGLQRAAWAWASGLNATGGAINPGKAAGYTQGTNGQMAVGPTRDNWTYQWRYHCQMDCPPQ